MPNLSFFADEHDAPLLLERLNDDPEVSFLVDDAGPIVGGSEWTWSRYRLMTRLPSIADGEHHLWHVAGHPFPSGHERVHPDPALSVIHFTLWSRHRPYAEDELQSLPARVSHWTKGHPFLASSHLSWLGNRYSIIGAPAHPATVKWWARLQRWMRSHATPLKVHSQVTFYAFPSALERLRAGVAYDANGFDLKRTVSNDC
jgi:hypothetical protein